MAGTTKKDLPNPNKLDSANQILAGNIAIETEPGVKVFVRLDSEEAKNYLKDHPLTPTV